MKRRRDQAVPMFMIFAGLAALAPAVHSAQAADRQPAYTQTQIQQHDMHDLTPLPSTPHDTFTGNPDSLTDAVPASAVPTGNSKKNKKSPSASAPTLNAPSSAANFSDVSTTQTPKTLGQKILDGTDLYYGMFLNGPSLGAAWGTTYSPFQQGTWPMYIYHTLDMQYHFDRTNLIGAELSAHQDLFTGVTPSGFYSPVEPKFDFNDPQLWYTRKAVIDTSYFSTDLQFSVWPAVTSYSLNEMGEYFSAAVDSTWNLKLRDRHWTTYFTTRFRPTVYGQLQPGDGFNREWLLLTTGYYVGYAINNTWQVNLSGVFDCDFYANNSQLWNRGDGSDDRAQFELNYFIGHYARLGGYFQTVVTNIAAVSSIVGLDFTINLLSAK